MLYIGVDWANDHHDIYALDPQGKKLASFQIRHDAKGFGELLGKIRKLSGREDAIFAIERNNGLLVDYILSHNYKIYPVPPQSMVSFRKRYTTSGARCDVSDALVLADVLRTDGHRFKPLSPDSDLARELRLLVQDREALSRHHTRLSNQLTSCLKEYYPMAIELFGSASSATCLKFVDKYPTMDNAMKLNLKQLQEFLKEANYPFHLAKKDLKELHELIKSEQLPVDPVVAKAKSRLARVLVNHLRSLAQQIKQYDKDINKLFDEHPDCGLFSSLPGAGDKLAPKLSTLFCENRDRYESYKGIQCLSGTAPVTESSGKYKHIYMRYACNKIYRHTMYQFAFSSLNRCLWARSYYDSKRDGGQTHTGALRALANKWLKIIYTMWKNHTCYNENQFLAARQKHVLLNVA